MTYLFFIHPVPGTSIAVVAGVLLTRLGLLLVAGLLFNWLHKIVDGLLIQFILVDWALLVLYLLLPVCELLLLMLGLSFFSGLIKAKKLLKQLRGCGLRLAGYAPGCVQFNKQCTCCRIKGGFC